MNSTTVAIVGQSSAYSTRLRYASIIGGAGVPQSTVMRFLFFIALALSSSMVCAADEIIRQAQALVDKGQPQAAYELLKPMEEARAGDPEFDYIYGLSALDSGRPLEAVFALERTIDAAPENGPARAELARAYLALGDTDEAKGEFDKLKDMDLPSDVERTIDSYISSIDQYHDRSRLRYRPYVKMGLGYDTNVNSATDQNIIAVPALGGLAFNLTDSSRESDSPIWDLGAGLRITSPLDYAKGLSLFINGEIDHRLALDEADFSALLANGQVGINWRRNERNQFRFSLDGNTVRVEGSSAVRSDREVIGTSGQWQYTMDEANQFTLFGQASLVRYPEQRVRDVNRYTGGVGWGHAFLGAAFDPVIFISAFGGIEDEKSESRGNHFSRDFFGVRGGGQIRIRSRGTLFGTITFQASNYNGTDPTFLDTRDDDFIDFNAGYRYQFDRNWSVSPTVAYNNNDSNFATSDYDRVEVMVMVRNDF